MRTPLHSTHISPTKQQSISNTCFTFTYTYSTVHSEVSPWQQIKILFCLQRSHLLTQSKFSVIWHQTVTCQFFTFKIQEICKVLLKTPLPKVHNKSPTNLGRLVGIVFSNGCETSDNMYIANQMTIHLVLKQLQNVYMQHQNEHTERQLAEFFVHGSLKTIHVCLYQHTGCISTGVMWPDCEDLTCHVASFSYS